MNEVWIAYYHDWSGFVIFDSEIDALRHAVEHSMTCGKVVFGEERGGMPA